MKATYFAAALGAIAVATSAIGVSSSAKAYEYDTSGFWPSEKYPHRNKSYDHLIDDPGLDWDTVHGLTFDLAFPQSRSALAGYLGYPTAYQGNYDYYRIAGSSSEIAIYYENDLALFFTVGAE